MQATGWQPLAGVNVVDFSMFVPGPFCTAILADLGADVIKVEPPAGDPARRYIPVQFRTENRNKRSLALDLKAEGARAVVERLARRADVAIEGFRPGVAARLGIDGESLARVNARLVCCSISGYGQTGPWRARPGHDVNYVAAAGGLAYPGGWLRPPARSSLPVADMGGGAFAAIAILAALAERARTGRGVRLDLSLFEAAFFWAAMRHGLDADAEPRAHLFPLNDVFETADGRRLALGILEEHFWRHFLRLAPELDEPRFASDEARRRHGDALSQRLAAVVKTKSAEEWLRLCAEADVPVDLCVTPAEAAASEQLRARAAVVEKDGVRHARFPLHADGRPAAVIRRGAPALGAHSREVLVELGFDDAQIAALVRAGVVRTG